MKKIKFVKMHGLGNDFILIDMIKDKEIRLDIDTTKRLCDRRLGIGADQVLLFMSSDKADYKMGILNSDGSEVEMCGNGIRCLARYINDQDSSKKRLNIETLAGIIKPEIVDRNVRVDMGKPVLEADNIPVDAVKLGLNNKKTPIIDTPLHIIDKKFNITCVSMGNPHCVIFCDNIADIALEKYGPVIENHSIFPKRINVEFVQVLDRKKIRMRVWERGSGVTLACGTGASASAVASILNNKTDRSVTVILDGGELLIEWKKDENVYMTGPAETVFHGEVEI